MPDPTAPIKPSNPHSSSKNRLLAFDYGLKRIGVATGNTITGTTQALSILSARKGTPDWSAIDVLITEWNPDLLIVGLPLNMDGSEGNMCALTRQFGNTLWKKYRLPVEFVDERLTSFSADNLIRQPDTPGTRTSMKRKAAIDDLAAELILQTYLENRDQEER